MDHRHQCGYVSPGVYCQKGHLSLLDSLELLNDVTARRVLTGGGWGGFETLVGAGGSTRVY